jgi:hypothetical protein
MVSWNSEKKENKRSPGLVPYSGDGVYHIMSELIVLAQCAYCDEAAPGWCFSCSAFS